jgi:hypothetical protein
MLPQRHGTIVWHGKGEEALLKLRRQIAIEEAAFSSRLDRSLNAICAPLDTKLDALQAEINALQDVFDKSPNFAPGLSKQVMK